MISFSQEYQTGVAVIDEQHKILFELINRIEYEVTNGFPMSLTSIIEELVQYTQYHFTTEEYLIQTYMPTIFETHRSQHNVFVADLQTLLADNPMELESIHQIHNFVVKWIQQHILIEDMLYAQVISEQMKGGNES